MIIFINLLTTGIISLLSHSQNGNVLCLFLFAVLKIAAHFMLPVEVKINTIKSNSFIFLSDLSFSEQLGLLSVFFMPPFKEEGVYCFANIGRSVGMSVGR